jgi:putative SOS response-associated peptidase YedK
MPRTLFSLAGFQVIITGRFWVIAEVMVRSRGELFAFAGIWDRWNDRSGKTLETCLILTTTPNAVTSPVHDRMPVILDPDGYDPWLDPGMKDVAAASDLLKPYDARLMRC